MSVSLIFLGVFISFSFYGLFASFNRLVRTNIGFLAAFILTGFIYLFDVVWGDKGLTNALYGLYLRIYPDYLKSFESFLITFYFVAFIAFYLFARLIIHYTMVGLNPTSKPAYLKYLHTFCLIAFIGQLFFLLSLVVPYTKEYFEIPFGFMGNYFKSIYRWML